MLSPPATEVAEGNVSEASVSQSVQGARWVPMERVPTQGWESTPPLGHGTCYIRLASGRYTSYWNAFLLPSATKLQQGNAFTPACQSFCSQGPGGCLADTPPGRHPHGQTPRGRHLPPPPDGHCSGRYASYWNAFLLIFFVKSCYDDSSGSRNWVVKAKKYGTYVKPPSTVVFLWPVLTESKGIPPRCGSRIWLRGEAPASGTKREGESCERSKPFAAGVQGLLKGPNMHSPTFWRLFFSHFWQLVQHQKLLKIVHHTVFQSMRYFYILHPFFNLQEKVISLFDLMRYAKLSEARKFYDMSGE